MSDIHGQEESARDETIARQDVQATDMDDSMDTKEEEDGQNGEQEPTSDMSGKLFDIDLPRSQTEATPPTGDTSEGVTMASETTPGIPEVRSPLADGIERQAIEHMARRAAGMSIGGDGNVADDSAQAQSSARKDDALPDPPPAPPVPEKDAPTPAEAEYDEKHPPPSDDPQNEIPDAPQGSAETTGLEIQTILEQFQTGGPGSEEIMTPIIERQQPILVLPPRTSSLEHRDMHGLTQQTTGSSTHSQPFSPPGAGRPPSITSNKVTSDDTESMTSVKAGSIFQPPPPEPDPDPPLPFDFHRFLEQLRHRTADPVARYLRSFLNEFGKKGWAVHEQVKIISDFLEFIAKKMAQCEVWRTVSDAEFDNAREGMEKLVMNRLYSKTFSPAIPPVVGSPRKGGRSAADMANPQGAGRRGQHQEDVERDEVIAQKMRIYGWIQEEHLDIAPINEKGRKFLTLAQKELLKIDAYRAPRDKVICVLNSCKVIFGYLKNSKEDQSADAFIPLLIYTVLRARPEHLVSNVQYIWRFRNQDKLGGEAGYYMSSLMGVVSFIENLDRTTITITDEEFERNVEQAVSAIAEKNKAEEYEEKAHAASTATPPLQQRLGEKSTLSRAEVTPKNSMDAERSSPRRTVTRERSQHRQQDSTDTVDDFEAVTGLLRTIGKPLSSIGRIFSDEGSSTSQPSNRAASTPLPNTTPRRLSPALPERRPSADGRSQPRLSGEGQAADAVERRAGAQRARAQEHKVVVETLQGMFPNLDKEVIEDVVGAQEGNVGRAVDACLALNNG